MSTAKRAMSLLGTSRQFADPRGSGHESTSRFVARRRGDRVAAFFLTIVCDLGLPDLGCFNGVCYRMGSGHRTGTQSWPKSRASSARAASLGCMSHGAACCRPAWRSARWHWASALRWGSPAARMSTCPNSAWRSCRLYRRWTSRWSSPRSAAPSNGLLSTSLRCAYAYRDIGGRRLYLRSCAGRSPGAWTRTPSPRPRRVAAPRSPRDHPRNLANADSKAVTPISPAAQKFHLFILCSALDNSVTVSDSSAPGLMLGKRHTADANQNIAEPHAAIITAI